MSLNRSVLSRVLNCFIDLLNQKPQLPHYITIIIDKDWFKLSGVVEYGASEACKVAINWWMCEFNKFVEIRKDHLYNKKPGALAIGSEPRFIWVSMIKRPIVRHEKLSVKYSLTRKFHSQLEMTVAEPHHCHVLYPESLMNPSDFDNWGRLTASGKITYWCSIDDSVRKFDRNQTDLKPRSSTPGSSSTKHHSQNKNW